MGVGLFKFRNWANWSTFQPTGLPAGRLTGQLFVGYLMKCVMI